MTFMNLLETKRWDKLDEKHAKYDKTDILSKILWTQYFAAKYWDFTYSWSIKINEL